MKTLIAFLALFSLSAFAQQINPSTQVNWPLVTGAGAPTISCGSVNYGQPYTDTTANKQYVCSTSGWTAVSSLTLQTNGTNNASQSLLNFNNTTPAAPSGYTNVLWQNSGGNESAYVTAPACTTANCVITNPTATQTITQPSSTEFNVDSPSGINLNGNQTDTGGYSINLAGTTSIVASPNYAYTDISTSQTTIQNGLISLFGSSTSSEVQISDMGNEDSNFIVSETGAGSYINFNANGAFTLGPAGGYGNAEAHFERGVAFPYTAESANYNITENDHYIVAKGGTTVTLIGASGSSVYPLTGTSFMVTAYPQPASVTVVPGTGSATIDGASSYTVTGWAVFTFNGTDWIVTSYSGGSGTVTSVAQTVPSWLSVSGSPITSSGTLAISAASGQTANEFLATPNGSSGAVGLRAIVAADIPTLNQSTTGNAATATALAATPSQCTGTQFAQGITASGAANCATPSGSMVYPGAGVANSTGTAWGTSYGVNGTGTKLTAPSGSPAAGDYVDGSTFAWTALPFQSLTTTGTTGAATLIDGVLNIPEYTGSSGTVTSVAQTVPSWLSVTGSPITTSGTLAISAASGQTANEFVATPNGSSGSVGLRAIAGGDFAGLTGCATANYFFSPAGNDCVAVSSMVYPGAGVPNSTGTAWGTSYTVGGTANDLVQFDSSGVLNIASGILKLTINGNSYVEFTTGNATNELVLSDYSGTMLLGKGPALSNGNLDLAQVQAGILYSAAGTALPACVSALQGTRAVVSDATTPTYMGAYTSGGNITAEVICSYNGTTYSWLTH